MWLVILSTVCAGLFAGAAIYVNAVEHPARLSCGTELAVREFAPSYRRGTVMPGHVSKLLRSWGWSPQLPERRARQRDEAAIERWRTERWPTIKKEGLR